MQKLQLLKWNLERVSPGNKEISLQERLHKLTNLIKTTQFEMAKQTHSEDIEKLVEMIRLIQKIYIDAFEMDEYYICLLSENVHDTKIQSLSGQCSEMKASMDSLLLTLRQILSNVTEDCWNALLEHPKMEGINLFLNEQRQMVKDQLNPELEKVIHTLSINGFNGWEDHYEQEFANLTVPIISEEGTKTVPFNMAYVKAWFQMIEKRGRRWQHLC